MCTQEDLVHKDYHSYNCVLDIKGHKWLFQYVVVNLWCWASTIIWTLSLS